MSDPITEQIIQKVITTLQTITTGNGYNQTVNTIHRPTTLMAREQAPYKSFDMVITLGETTANDELDAQGNPPIIGLTQPLQLDMIYRPSKTATVPIETVLLRFEADVRKALMADPQQSGLAVDADMKEPAWWGIDDEGTVGATVMFNVHFRIFENDPYTQT